MTVTRDISYLLLGTVLALHSHSCLSQNCPTNLINKVVYEGTSASFDRANDGEVVQWQVSPASYPVGLQDITNTDGTVLDPFTSTHAANQTHLTILKSTASPEGSMPYSTGGLYALSYQSTGCMTVAGLIVIKSGPVCTCDSTIPSTLSCQVEYAEFINQQIIPIITWTDSNGVTVWTGSPTPSPIDTDNQPGLFRSVSQLSVSDNNVYRCQLTFSEEITTGLPPEFARNAPDFTGSCTISRPECA